MHRLSNVTNASVGTRAQARWLGALFAACLSSVCASASAQSSYWGRYVGFDESGDNVYAYCQPDAIVAKTAVASANVTSYLHRVTSDGTRTSRIVSAAAVNRARIQCYDNAQFTGTPTLVVGAASLDNNQDRSVATCPPNKPHGAHAECQLTLAGPYPQNGGDDGAFVYYGSACGNGISAVSSRMVGQQTGSQTDMTYRISDHNNVAATFFFNDTVAAANIHGTDLGTAFYSAGKMYFAFGDSKNAQGNDADASGNPRHTALAYAWPFYGLRTFFGGVPFSGWYGANSAPLDAKQVIPSSSNINIGPLPSGAFAISEGGHNYKYMAFTQVAAWNPFTLGGPSSIGYSIDDAPWQRADATAAWQTVTNAGIVSRSNFTTVATYQEEVGPAAGYVYLFGTDSVSAYGSFVISSRVKLARVRARHASIIDKTQYTYWNGSTWTSNESAAAFVLPDTRVRDVSVAYNSYANRYMLMYLDGNGFDSKLVLLTATSLTGPWTPSNLPIPYKLGMYSPIMHGRMMPGAGQHVSYFVSTAGPRPYNVGAWYMDVTRASLSGCSP